MEQQKTVLVIGGGTAGWMAAGYFAVKGYAVTLIESPEVPIVGVGESTLPATNWFANELGMQEHEWMPLSNATFKLGIRHRGWGHKDFDWWHWFLYDRAHVDRMAQHLQDGTLPARENLEYAYHVDAAEFGQTICRVAAMKFGCQHVISHVTGVEGNPESGIQRVITRDGRQWHADFYVDCTGWRKLLAQVVQARYQPYTYFLNDRAIACPQASESTPKRYTETRARAAGWMWEIPLTTRRGVGYVYSSNHISDQDAMDEYVQSWPNTDTSKMRVLKFTPECCMEPVKTNVAVVGLSGGFIEPLEATSLFLTQFMIQQSHLVFSGQRSSQVVNRNQRQVFDHTALFVLAHYTLSKNRSNDYWQYWADLETKINTREQVLHHAQQKDSGVWRSSKLFFPYNWWSMARAYEIMEQ